MKCELCTIEGTSKDLEYHYAAKHKDLSNSDRKHYLIEEQTLIVEGREFSVFRRTTSSYNDLYYCSVCIASGGKEVIEYHLVQYHYKSHEERKFDKQVRKFEKRANIEYCIVCWEKIITSNHYTSFYHIEKEEYVEGSGCDICRTTSDPLKDHYNSKEHSKALNYVTGTGCDICKQFYRKAYHNNNITHGLNYIIKHNLIENYIPGTGCDVCRLVYPTHENSKRHKNKVKQSKNIYDLFIAPRIRAKSARK